MMKSVSLALAVLVLSLLVTRVRPSTWGYTQGTRDHMTEDPKHWKPDVCQFGKNQSPINIGSRNTIVERDVPKLEFHRYDEPFEVVDTVNNGHTLMVYGFNHHRQGISGAMLPNLYYIEQLHFHWGKHSNLGSEHTIDNKRYPLEMHLVHYNSKYNNVSEAVLGEERNGLAVISVLFEISKEDNEKLEPIIRKTHAVREVDGEVVSRGFEGVALDDLLPKDKENFFTYEGSLTTPPCAEVVSWIVLKDKGTISENQIKLFRELEVWQGRLKKNFRPLQELHSRVIIERS